jgi:hypothetical protein
VRPGRHLSDILGFGRPGDGSGQGGRGGKMQERASIDRHAHCSKTDAISEIADMVSVVKAGGELMPRRFSRSKARR